MEIKKQIKSVMMEIEMMKTGVIINAWLKTDGGVKGKIKSLFVHGQTKIFAGMELSKNKMVKNVMMATI